MPYQVSDDKKVTVRKILSMRNHWYAAALGEVGAHIETLRQRKKYPRKLSKLKARYQQEAVALPNPHPATGAGLDDYVPDDRYAIYFDRELPAGLAREIKEAYD